ncbi:General secretion pathway protein I [Klebsiella michiganensis]|uniref:General secretion pathway protein I n=1 Tax=Klebsiella michiganensis TaxID=1134687 RepID=A0A7H4N5C0_9ENTR|nr:General secretion pathway protein I [Klebsiella michiganensis]
MNKQKGMTLLEVLVALAIFALAGLTLLQTHRPAGQKRRHDERENAGKLAGR